MSVKDRWQQGRRRTPEWGRGLRWEVFYRDTTGKQRRRRFETKAEALDFEAELRLSPRARAARMTVTELWEAWIAGKQRSVKPRTLSGYESTWRAHIAPELASRAVATLTAAELRGWYGRIPSRDAARVALVIMRGMLDLAVEDELLPANPVASLRGGQSRRREVTPIPADQLHALADALAPHDRELWLLAACGLRFGEMAGLSRSRLRQTDQGWLLRIDRTVQRAGGETIWGSPKGGRPRDVPCPAWLADQMPASGDPLLPAPDGGPWLSDLWRPRWDTARRAVGLPDLHTHDLRHTFAARQIEAGTDLKTLQLVMGHAHLSITTDIYGSMAAPKLGSIADIRAL